VLPGQGPDSPGADLRPGPGAVWGRPWGRHWGRLVSPVGASRA